MQSFDSWFSQVQSLVECGGHRFNDEDSVRADYEEGRSAEDVAQKILDEYNA